MSILTSRMSLREKWSRFNVSLRENDRAPPHQGNAIFSHKLDCAGENDTLDIATEGDEVAWRSRVTHSNNVLINDRSLVKVPGDEVRRRPNEFHPSFVRLMVGPCTLKTGQKGVVDVYNPPSHRLAELG